METEVFIIIAVFGGILATMLYKYLLQSPEHKEGRQQLQQNQSGDTAFLEPLAERVYRLFEKVEALEENFNNLEAYVQQKVEIWRKKEKAKGTP